MELSALNLAVTFFSTFDRKPLVILRDLPQELVCLPGELRALAAALTAIAEDSERGHPTGPFAVPRAAEYEVARYIHHGRDARTAQ